MRMMLLKTVYVNRKIYVILYAFLLSESAERPGGFQGLLVWV